MPRRAERTHASSLARAARDARSRARLLRSLAARFGAFAAIVALGLCAWPLLGETFSRGFEQVARVALDSSRFGERGRAVFVGVRRGGGASSRAEGDPSWNTGVSLVLDGTPEAATILFNPRRLAYLPLLVFAAAVAVAPLSWPRRALCWLAGAALLGGLSIASVWLQIAWIFSRIPAVGYTLPPLQQSALELVCEVLLGQLAVKYIAPLSVALLLVSWLRTPFSTSRRADPGCGGSAGASTATARGARG